MRGFKFARNRETMKQAFPEAKIPVRKTRHSAGYDFFCAKEVTIQPFKAGDKPVRVNTGIKAKMLDDEVLLLFNRSSNPGKKYLVLANGVGVVDSDYFENIDNDGEIQFAFYNMGTEPITIHVGDTLGQGMFTKFLATDEGGITLDEERVGGFSSTDKG